MKRTIACSLLVGHALFVSACSMRGPKVQGKFSARGGELGNYELAPDRCQSGGNWNFYGVAFFAGESKDSVLEIVEDPAKGWLAKVAVPKQHDMVVFSRSECRVLEPRIAVEHTRNHPQGWMSGHARFNCTASDGLHAEGDLDFQDCN
jgi:hypothetical protein